MNREQIWSDAVTRSANRRGVVQWKCLPWWRKAATCCAQPTLPFTLVFVIVGLLFMVGAPVLDPDLAFVGLILIGVGVAMMLVYALLAYHSFARREPQSRDCRPGR